MFAYCGNNPVSRSDSGGCFWDIVFDVASLVCSVIEVVNNPDDIGAWVGLVCDVVDVAIPCVGGLGEAARAVDAVLDAAEAVDDVHDATKVVENVSKSTRASAVRKAWKNEAELVATTGKGTRNWTDVEIEELLTTGKVKGYNGHHMKSVKGYPELAGDPLNIQFLTRKEHLAAYGGNWQNITHGRYEP
jgi:hypothetical protein